ncbi:MAG: protein kinase domain-containing protein [Gemmatimonadota bacterium]
MSDILRERVEAALGSAYEIEGELGRGGMGVVYRALDRKLRRPVAIKVLPPELAYRDDVKQRFLREAQTAAQLNHPNIVPIYAVEERDGLVCFVMALVEGEPLALRLATELRPPVAEVCHILRGVADALAYAHARGIVHRDIKPDNILIDRATGRPMVTDFGIARDLESGALTKTGALVGTPHYMSPEQATADKHITNRSDIYSLGSVLYELLTGEPPHTGASAQMIVMKIVTDVARPVSELRKAVPPHVAAAVARALEKLPADRFESAKAFAEALHNPAFVSPVARATAVGAVGPASRRFALPALLALTLLAIAVGAWGWIRPSRTTSVARYPTTLGASGALDGITFAVEAALAPDGASLVFRSPLAGPGQLYIKRRDEVAARPLAGTEGGSGPFFSPDGAWIGFVANGQLRRIPSAGGASLKLADSVDPTYNRAAWLEDGSIVHYDFTAHTLRRLGSGDATSKVIVSPAMLDGRYPWLPSPLPSSRGVLFTAHLTNCVGPVSCRPSRVYVWDARKDTIRTLFDDAIGAWHVPTGHVLYLTSAGTLMAAPWDNDALAATGRPVPVMDGIQAPGFVVSGDGTAYYLLGRSEFAPGPVPNAAVVWVDRTGHVEPVDSSWQVNTGGTDDGGIGTDWGLALSPDRRRLALSLLTDLGTDIWIKQLPAGPASRLTLYDGVDRSPAWAPDGRAVTFLSDRPISTETNRKGNPFSVWEQAADGAGEPRLLWGKDAPTDAFRSPDGRWPVLGATTSTGASAERGILATQPGTDSPARRIMATGSDASGAALSPDSRWVAYVSNEQGANEVFVRPFPDVNGGKWQVSSGGGSAPLWAHNGRELFYAANGKMHVVRINPGPSFSAEPPRVLFAIPERVRAGSLASGTFAITPDDRRFLMVRDNSWGDMAGTPALVVVQGFLDELRAKLKR